MPTLEKTRTEIWAGPIVEEYMTKVLSGSIPACKYTRLAVERHLRDLEEGPDRGLSFDEEAAQHIIDFFGHLKHSKGEWAGKPFKLEEWQMFILWVLFGWKNAAGLRRFRVAYNEVARKNGKSTFAAGIGLYCLAFDDEPGAEVYSVATKEEQAKITFHEAQRMTLSANRLGGRATVHKKSISIDKTYSSWKPLGSDSHTEDGLNPHCSIVDELHAHPDSGMWDVIDSAMGARRQPLIFAITTAGFNKQCFCHQQRDLAIGVLEGTYEDDTLFAIIYTLDEKDDWRKEECWIKANPNLNVTVKIEDMQRLCRGAIESPEKRNNFLTKKLNIWTTAHVQYFNMEKWNNCPIIEISDKELLGRDCYLAEDLSCQIDLACHLLLFPLDDGRMYVRPYYYCPEEGARERVKKDRVPYLKWAEAGHIKLTAGSRIDYAFIKKDIVEAFSKYNVIALAYDPWNFEAVRQDLIAEGIPEEKMVQFTQTIKYMSAPTKDLEAMVLDDKLVHNNHPVLAWNAENTVVYIDPNDNVRPLKNKSKERIDGVIATVMARGVMMAQPQEPDSVYEKRGFLDLDKIEEEPEKEDENIEEN